MIASVKNQKGELVGALQKSDFQVFDNGVKQEIAVFERQTEQPLSIALMIDISGSTAKDLKYETDSAAKFLRALLAEGNPEDSVALFTFDADVRRPVPFTHNYATLESALKLIRGSGGTSLYDAIYLASEELERRKGRKVMVVISDGGKYHQLYGSQAIFECRTDGRCCDLRRWWWCRLLTMLAWNTGGENALIFMAERTGGRTFFPSVGKELDKAFADIISELRTAIFHRLLPAWRAGRRRIRSTAWKSV